MQDSWFISDHHFNHANILTFRGLDGELVRPGYKHPVSEVLKPFKDIDHMNELMIERHNAVVKPHDKVYFGGDIGRKCAHLIRRMNGHKRLVLGNHDKLTTEEAQCFKRVYAWRFFGDVRPQFVLSHFPLHPDAFIYRTRDGGDKNVFNVHGHIHEKTVDDLRFINVCAEQLDYRPINMDSLVKAMNKRLGLMGKQ